MHEVLASTLPQKPVFSADGRKLGTVHNLTINVKTGALEYLIVRKEVTERRFDELDRTEDGHLRVPATGFTGVDDHLVVDLSEDQ